MMPTDQSGERDITLRPSAVAGALAATEALLIVAFLGSWQIWIATGHSLFGLTRMFNLDAEFNIPTFFAGALLLMAAAIAAVIAALKTRVTDPYFRHWTILASALLWMAFDEASGFHETLVAPTRWVLKRLPDAITGVAWVIPVSLVCLALGWYFLRFWRHLPRRTGQLLLVAAVVFFVGAIGVETVGGYVLRGYSVVRDGPWFPYAIVVTLEEGLEMAGVIVLIYTLLDYLEQSPGQVRFRVGRASIL